MMHLKFSKLVWSQIHLLRERKYFQNALAIVTLKLNRFSQAANY